jgi:hypothetical protein
MSRVCCLLFAVGQKLSVGSYLAVHARQGNLICSERGHWSGSRRGKPFQRRNCAMPALRGQSTRASLLDEWMLQGSRLPSYSMISQHTTSADVSRFIYHPSICGRGGREKLDDARQRDHGATILLINLSARFTSATTYPFFVLSLERLV